MPKERPILFSAPMVRAILNGSKTQTRRIIKPVQPRNDGLWPAGRNPVPDCPYGVPGGRLWVRETWADVNSYSGPGFAYKADGAFVQPEYDGEDFGAGPSFNYDKYPGDYTMWYTDLLNGESGHRWRASNHMPRWASRILLEITGISVERLQDISEDDAKAEGCRPVRGVDGIWAGSEGPGKLVTPWPTAKEAFADIWETIYGADSWDANPWVWVLSFRRIGE
jgi:hypothetical protein